MMRKKTLLHSDPGLQFPRVQGLLKQMLHNEKARLITESFQ